MYYTFTETKQTVPDISPLLYASVKENAGQVCMMQMPERPEEILQPAIRTGI